MPNVVGKRLGAAKLTIKRRHCRTAKVGYAYSRERKKGIIISQSRRPGRVVPANSKINLVVSTSRSTHRRLGSSATRTRTLLGVSGTG